MKVKTSGFALDFTDTNIFAFLRYLKQKIDYRWQNRILVVDQIANNDILWGGYLLYYRPEKKTPQVLLTEHEIETLLYEITEENRYHGEFNFFIINTNTRKGLFQSHAKTSGWTFFSSYLGHRFNEFKRDTNNRAAWFYPSALFTQGGFEDYLEKFERIKEVTIETSKYEVEENNFRALGDEASRNIKKYLFYKRDKPNLKKIKQSLSSIFREKQADDLRVDGIVGGMEVAYELANNAEVFHQEDYDHWMSRLTFTDKDISLSVNSSQTIKDLINIYYETLPITRLNERDKGVIGL